MVAKTLVDSDIRAGRRLIEKLDAHMDVRAALWLYLPEAERWRLVVATPKVDAEGPRATYAAVQEVIDAIQKESAEESSEQKLPALWDITVVSPSDKTIQLLASAVKTGDQLQAIRFTGNAINGVFIEDALIYRMNVN